MKSVAVCGLWLTNTERFYDRVTHCRGCKSAFKSGESMGDIVVVGGGSAGMMAAISAAENGAEVVITEGNEGVSWA